MVNFRKKKQPFYMTKTFLSVGILVVLTAAAGVVLVKTNLFKAGSPSTDTTDESDRTASTPNTIKRISFKLNNERFAEYSRDGSSTLNDSDLMPHIDTYGHRGKITDLLFLENGETLLSTSLDNTVCVWDLSDLQAPRLVTTIRIDSGVRAVTLSPDRRLLAVGSKGVEFYDLEIGSRVLNTYIELYPVTDMAFTDDGKYFVCSDLKGKIKLLDLVDFHAGNQYSGHCGGILLINGHTRTVNTLSMSRDLLASASDDGTVRLWSVENFHELKALKAGPVCVIDEHDGKVNVASFSNSGEYLLTGGEDKMLLLFDRKGKLIKEFLQLDSPPISLAFSPDDRMVILGMRGGSFGTTTGIYTFPDGDIVKTMDEHPDRVKAVASTVRENRTIFASGGGLQNRIVLWDADGNRISTIASRESFICSVGFLKKQKKLGFGTGLTINDLTSDTPLEYEFDLINFQMDLLSAGGDFTSVRHRLDSRELSRETGYKAAIDAWFPSDALNIYKNGEVENIILRGTINGRVHKCFTFVGKNLIASGGEDGELCLYSLSGDPLVKLIGHKGDILALAPSDDGNWLASVSSDRSIRVWDLRKIFIDPSENTMSISQILEKADYNKKELVGIDEILLGIYTNNPVEYRALANYYLKPQTEKFPTLTLFPIDMQWLAFSEENFFNASSREILKRLSFFIWGTNFSYERLYDVYFKPSFFKDLFKERDIRYSFEKDYAAKVSQNMRRDILKQALVTSEPPKVEFASLWDGMKIKNEELEVKVKVTDQGGGIGDIRLYQNGKLVASEGLVRLKKWESVHNVVVQADQNTAENMPFYKQSGIIEKTYRIKLVTGANEVSCSAMNYKNSIASGMQSVTVEADIPEQTPKLYILALGMLKFKDDRMNLRYTHADAHGIATRLREKKAERYVDISVTELLDPGKEHIIEAVSKLKNVVKPSDTFVFCISTHGTAENDVYYLLTSDFEGQLTEDVCITNKDLMKISMDIPALNQVFILDACHSGTADFTFGDMYREGATYFSSGYGVHLMAASAPLRYALEGYNGHGIFSYYLMMGMSGAADKNGDHDITMKELSDYVSESVKNLTYGFQIPVVSNFGKDMVITQRR